MPEWVMPILMANLKKNNMKTVLYGPSNIIIVIESMKIPEKVGGVLDLSINQY